MYINIYHIYIYKYIHLTCCACVCASKSKSASNQFFVFQNSSVSSSVDDWLLFPIDWTNN